MIDIQVGSEQETDKLGNLLFRFNETIVPEFQGKTTPSESVRYVIKHQDNLIAGILGRVILNNVLYIDVLFVEERYRHKGYATSLMQKLEKEAQGRGCYLAYLDTINLSAVTFYEKLGYEVFAKLDDIPVRGVTAFYMKKQLVQW
jgi:GNAT superfamily N-acetyltransferase